MTTLVETNTSGYVEANVGIELSFNQFRRRHRAVPFGNYHTGLRDVHLLDAGRRCRIRERTFLQACAVEFCCGAQLPATKLFSRVRTKLSFAVWAVRVGTRCRYWLAGEHRCVTAFINHTRNHLSADVYTVAFWYMYVFVEVVGLVEKTLQYILIFSEVCGQVSMARLVVVQIFALCGSFYLVCVTSVHGNVDDVYQIQLFAKIQPI